MLLAFRGLRELGFECEVFCIDYEGEYAKQFQAEGFPVHLKKFQSRMDPLGLAKLWNTGRRFDIVHGHMYAANLAVLTAFRKGRRPSTVAGYHNQTLVSSERQTERLRKSLHRPTAYVAVGEAVRDSLIRLGAPPERIAVIRNGVVGPAEVAPLPSRAVGEPLRLVWMGRFAKQKRVPFLIDVAAECKRRRIPVQMTLFGTGEFHEKAMARLEDEHLQDVVLLPGISRSIFDELARAHLFLSASYREGFPNALLEALAAGRPAIVNTIDPNREVLGDSGAGLMIDTDVHRWADAIGRLVENGTELQRMAAEAESLGRKFSMKRAVDETAGLYRKITL